LDGPRPYQLLQSLLGQARFKFVEYVKGSHVVLEANNDYFKGKPCINRVTFQIIPDPTAALQAFLAGQGDLLNNRPPTTEIPKINSTPGVIVQMRPVPSRWYIAYNLLNPLLSNLKMRLAIAYAINRTELVQKAESGYGFVARGMYPPAIQWAFNPNVILPEYNPAKADALLDELGYKKGSDGYRYAPDGTKLTLRFTIFQGAEAEAIATIIKEQLRKVGIDVKVEVLEIAAWENKVVKQRDFDLAMLDGFQGPDPDNMRSRFGPGAYLNMANYSNPVFGDLLNKAASEPDPQKRKELYWKAQEIMANDLPYLPLVDLVAFFIYRTEWHGFYWQLPGIAGLNVLERVWWEKGTPVTTTTISIPTQSTSVTPSQVQQGISTTMIIAVVGVIIIVAIILLIIRRRGS